MALEIMNFNFPSTKGNLEAQASLTRSSFRSGKKLSSELSEKGNCFAKNSLLKVVVETNQTAHSSTVSSCCAKQSC